MTITTRSKRVSAFGSGVPTPTTVAPGSYASEQVATSFSTRSQRPLYSSFATSEKRNLNENKTTSAITPGPGAYIDGSRHQHPLAPSNVFATKISRFAPSAPGSTVFRASSVQDNPGPGSYSYQHAAVAASSNQREHQTPGKFAHLLKPSVPAIPQRQQSYGYVQVGAELQRQPPPTEVYSGVGQDTVGPAAYSHHGPVWNAKKNAAASLRSTAKREVWEENKPRSRVPGPGHYHETPATTSSAAPAPISPVESSETPVKSGPRIGARRRQSQQTRRSAVFASKVPILPTPKSMTQYDAEREQELQLKDERAERQRQEKKRVGIPTARSEAFGSNTGRMQLSTQLGAPFSRPSFTVTPGPGMYGTTSSYTARNKRQSGKSGGAYVHPGEGVGFSSATERACLAPTKTPTAPGPGAYRSETPRSLTHAVKGKLTIGRHGVFGSTSERQVWGQLERMDAQEFTPGPGAYSASLGGSFTLGLNSAAFKSGSSRFAKNGPPHLPPHMHCVGAQDTPAVGQYNLSLAFPAVVLDRSGASANGDALLSPRVPFLSTQERSVFDVGELRDLPGPGAYRERAEDPSTGFTRSRDVRLTLGNERRFRVKPTVPEAVGPGAYSIPDTMGSKSFNVTMARKGKDIPPPARAQGRASSSPSRPSAI